MWRLHLGPVPQLGCTCTCTRQVASALLDMSPIPKTMQAAQVLEWTKPYEVREIEVPQPTEWQLLLETKAAGYCHTDAMIR